MEGSIVFYLYIVPWAHFEVPQCTMELYHMNELNNELHRQYEPNEPHIPTIIPPRQHILISGIPGFFLSGRLAVVCCEETELQTLKLLILLNQV